MGNRLKDMDIDQVQTTFNVPKEQWYTQEERDKLAKEMEWVNS